MSLAAKRPVSALEAGWDVEAALAMSYNFTPTVHDAARPVEAQGLEPEGEAGGDSWQDEFALLETTLLASNGVGKRALKPVVPAAANVPKEAPAAAAPLKEKPLAATVPLREKPQPILIPGFGFSSKSTTSVGDGGCGVANGSGDMGHGMNMDKRRCRQLHRDAFIAAITAHRSKAEAVDVTDTMSQSMPLGGAAKAEAMPLSKSMPPGVTAGGALVRSWVRKRPLLAHELTKDEYDAVSVRPSLDGSLGSITTHACLMKPDLRRMFIRHASFRPSGGVFGETATSADVFNEVGVPLVNRALSGGHGTCILYGQTGSGKTMTLAHIQKMMAERLFAGNGSQGGVALAVQVNAVEVMGKKVRDLSSGNECLVYQTNGGGAELRGATNFMASSASELVEHLKSVLRSRATQSTGSNSTSSRSHALISLRIGTSLVDDGRITLLDCAGSEWASDSTAHNAQRRREGSEINASLHALKNCIRAHAQRQRLMAGAAKSTGKPGAAKPAPPRVPYRDALLTRLLRDCFEPERAARAGDGGYTAAAGQLAIVGCVSPGAADCEHSTSTLRTVMELAATAGDECETSIQDVPRIKKA